MGAPRSSHQSVREGNGGCLPWLVIGEAQDSPAIPTQAVAKTGLSLPKDGSSCTG